MSRRKPFNPEMGQRLIEIAADVFGTTASEIIGGNRMRECVEARWAVCWILFERGWSMPGIQSVLKLRSHSTVIAAVQQVRAIRDGQQNPRGYPRGRKEREFLSRLGIVTERFVCSDRKEL